MDERLKELSRMLCKWNRKEMSADELAYEAWKLFEEEALEIWNDPLEKLLV